MPKTKEQPKPKPNFTGSYKKKSVILTKLNNFVYSLINRLSDYLVSFLLSEAHKSCKEFILPINNLVGLMCSYYFREHQE